MVVVVVGVRLAFGALGCGGAAEACVREERRNRGGGEVRRWGWSQALRGKREEYRGGEGKGRVYLLKHTPLQ